MKSQDIDFGRVLGASGVQGFFGEGYRTHKLLGPFGPRFDGMTFVAKTTTLKAREGNMPLRKDFTPVKLFPDCVVVTPMNFRRGVVLNSVGLSGPGAEALFERGEWQQRPEPLMISFMAMGESLDGKLRDLRAFVDLLLAHLPEFNAPVGLQLNFSCPNVESHSQDFAKEVVQSIVVASVLGIPLMPKFNVLTPPEFIYWIIEKIPFDGICVSNTIPWDELPKVGIDRRKLFGSNTSPLEKLGYGKGGLSGKPLLPLLLDWLKKARRLGIDVPINAGGGILSADDAEQVMDAGADSIFLGSVAILRPWRVAGIIRRLS